MVNEAERVRGLYDGLADRYDSLIRIPERLLFGGGREWACSRARGEVLEVAVGTGRNFAYYPEGAHLTGVELSPAMLEIAPQARGGAGRRGRPARRRRPVSALPPRVVRHGGLHPGLVHHTRRAKGPLRGPPGA